MKKVIETGIQVNVNQKFGAALFLKMVRLFSTMKTSMVISAGSHNVCSADITKW